MMVGCWLKVKGLRLGSVRTEQTWNVGELNDKNQSKPLTIKSKTFQNVSRVALGIKDTKC